MGAWYIQVESQKESLSIRPFSHTQDLTLSKISLHHYNETEDDNDKGVNFIDQMWGYCKNII